jgi:sigma-B regulation protein RsbU (phosphoserine phosphatase)
MPSELVPGASTHAPVSGVFPHLIFVQVGDEQTLTLDHSPFTIGRKPDKDLMIADPRVSRDHASILSENGEFAVVDEGSKHGTFVNGNRVRRANLKTGDRLEFGGMGGVYVIFNPRNSTFNPAREFLSQIAGPRNVPAGNLEKLTLFLDAARKLNTSGILDEILITLLDTTLKLTGAERGYVFLKNDAGAFRLAAGRNAQEAALLDDKTISHSILEEALNSNSEFLVTDSSHSPELADRQSIVTYDLRTVICIPLRRQRIREVRSAHDAAVTEVIGALYVDSRYASHDISRVDHDILRTIAHEAASLVENARLVEAEEAARRYQQELSIAASIQQQLMTVTIPEVSFATVVGKNVSCKQIGGDFFDVVNTEEGLAIVLVDVSGKGVSAALLASTLQGMIYSHMVAGMPLREIVGAVNRFLTRKLTGEKYATLVLARLRRDGELEYVNCGHIPPLLICNGEVIRPSHGNLPVGLIGDATFDSDRSQLRPGDRLILVTDGVTEAENAEGEFFEKDRLEAVAGQRSGVDEIFSALSAFCCGVPLNDDCTVVELKYVSEQV